MASRVTDAEKNRFVFGFGQRFFAPWIPIHGMVGVLAQVGRGGVGKAVGQQGTLCNMLAGRSLILRHSAIAEYPLLQTQTYRPFAFRRKEASVAGFVIP